MQGRIDPLGSEEVRRALAFTRARERYPGTRRDDLLSCCEAAWEAAVTAGDAGDPIDRFQRTLNLIAWTRGWTRGPVDLRDLDGQPIPLAVLRPFMLAGGDAPAPKPPDRKEGLPSVHVPPVTGKPEVTPPVGAPAPKPPMPPKPGQPSHPGAPVQSAQSRLRPSLRHPRPHPPQPPAAAPLPAPPPPAAAPSAAPAPPPPPAPVAAA